MKNKGILLCAIFLCVISVTGCTKKSENNSTEKENSSLKAENRRLSSSLATSTSTSESSQSSSIASSSSSNENQPASDDPIQTAQDAANLITHSMHVNPGIYHAVPTTGGFLVSREDEPGTAFVRYNGDITWNNGDTVSYDQAAAPTINY